MVISCDGNRILVLFSTLKEVSNQVVAPTCNPSSSRGWGKKLASSRPPEELLRPCNKMKFQKSWGHSSMVELLLSISKHWIHSPMSKWINKNKFNLVGHTTKTCPLVELLWPQCLQLRPWRGSLFAWPSNLEELVICFDPQKEVHIMLWNFCGYG